MKKLITRKEAADALRSIADEIDDRPDLAAMTAQRARNLADLLHNDR